MNTGVRPCSFIGCVWEYILAPIPPHEREDFLAELTGEEIARLTRLAIAELERGADAVTDRLKKMPRKPSSVRGLTQERYRSRKPTGRSSIRSRMAYRNK
jgi:hypothetical protein